MKKIKQSVKGGASSHLRPCKVSFADKHNLREDDHPSNKNIRPELSKNNSYWLDPEVPNLVALDRKIRKDYLAHNGRTLPTCGPTKASPLKETVTILPSGDRSTDEIQMRITTRIEKRFHIRCIRRYIHRDEYCAETNTFNWHGHEIWDFYDDDNHRIIQLDRQDLREWQDIVAEETGMARGTPAYETDRRWLTATEYKIQEREKDLAKKKEELELVGLDVKNEFTLKEGLERFNTELAEENEKIKEENEKLEVEKQKRKALLNGVDGNIKKEIQKILDKYCGAGYVLQNYNIIFLEKEAISPYGEKSKYEEESYVLEIQIPDGRFHKLEIHNYDYHKSSNDLIKEIGRFFFGLPTFKKKLVSSQRVQKPLKNSPKL